MKYSVLMFLFLPPALFLLGSCADRSASNHRSLKILTYNPPPQLGVNAYNREKSEKDIPSASNLSSQGYFKTGLCGQFTATEESSKNHSRHNSKSIYGIDNRMPFCQFTGDSEAVDMAQATAMTFYAHQLKKVDTVKGEDLFDIQGVTVGELMLRQNKNVCPDVVDYSQMSYGYCTAVLIAPQILLTPKHCLNMNKAEKLGQNLPLIRYAFTINEELTRYQNKDLTRQEFILEKSQIFSIDRLIYLSPNNDFALVRLKEPTTGIVPMNLLGIDNTFAAKIKAQDLTLFGHPLGEKLNLNFGKAISATDNLILSTLDSFQGNSGSPVFARHLSGRNVIGILIKGMDDWVYNLENDCVQEAVYPEELNSPQFYESILSAQLINAEIKNINLSR